MEYIKKVQSKKIVEFQVKILSFDFSQNLKATLKTLFNWKLFPWTLVYFSNVL